jgi:predicted ATPase/serine phosphatase RsbU (regulator of sigma subunit)
MLDIPGYAIIETLYESVNSLVYRAETMTDHQLVILKLLKNPTPEKIAWFKREYEITNHPDIPGIATIYSLDHDPYWMMVIEDGGTSLKQLDLAGRIPIATFLDIALAITDILAQVQQKHIIHKDINPANILYNPDTGQVKLIDFGIATVLSYEITSLNSPNSLEGTLAYISPEQTGRMNRNVDYRTDFYSLGVTLYELLTGVLPFTSEDPMELIHSHIARQPTLPHQQREDIPPMLSAIIMKLMAKNAEDRYQSAYGLRADLERCQQQWATTGTIESFPLAEYDVSDRFQIPQKLYGRENEIHTLLTTLDRVCEGEREMMLISGYAGVGKSLLAQEIQKPITEHRGFYTIGKFDHYQRHIPYAGIIQAFRRLVQQLLSQSEKEILAWKERILSYIAPSGQVIVEVIPDVEIIIGKQPPTPTLDSAESRDRFTQVFHQFIKAFLSPEHPLVLMLEDLQWADLASFELIEQITADPDTHYLFIIGTFRDNEEDSLKPLRLMLNITGYQVTAVHHLALNPLSLDYVTQLIAETFHCTNEHAQPLAELVVQKTDGNPFFVNEFLQTLYTDSQVRFDYEQGVWQWDLDEIKAQDITTNLVDLMTLKVQRLPEQTQMLLKIAACIGNEFDLHMLTSLSGLPMKEITNHLRVAVDHGFIEVVGTSDKAMTLCLFDANEREQVNTTYKFAHARIHQVVYTTIRHGKEYETHWMIGQLLLQSMTESQRNEHIFDLVGQLNKGWRCITNLEQRIEVASLNLHAGRKAMESVNYDSATVYFVAGTELLAEQGWTAAYTLMFELSQEYARCAYLTNATREAERVFAEMLSHVQSSLDKALLYATRMELYASRGQIAQVVETGLEGLALIGLDLPSNPDEHLIETEYQQVQARIGGRAILDLMELPQATAPQHIAKLRLLTDILVNAWWAANTRLLSLVTLTMIKLSLQYGNTEYSAFGYVWYGMFLGTHQQNYEHGQQFGYLALQLVDDYAATHHVPKVSCIFGVFVDPWRSHFRTSIQYLSKGFDVGVAIGDSFWAGVNSYTMIYTMLIKGDALDEVLQQSHRNLDYAKKTRQAIPINMITFTQQFIRCMQGQTRAFGSLSDDSYDEETHIQKIRKSGTLRPYYWYTKLKMQALYLAGDYDEALALAMEADRYTQQGASLGVVTLPEHYLYFSLILAACIPNASPEQSEEYWHLLQRNQQHMQVWAKNCPVNFRHKYLLVEAEIAWLKGKIPAAALYYHQAKVIAQEHGFMHIEALANERNAYVLLAQGQDTEAMSYLLAARKAYISWGASAKVNRLDEAYPALLQEAYLTTQDTNHNATTISQMSTTTTSSQRATMTSGNIAHTLDFSSVLKASQTISGEIVLENLLTKIMNIVLESAGAERGYLLLDEQGQLVIEAEGTIASQDIAILQETVKDEDEQQADRLPVSILNYVARTMQPIVLNNASQEGQFTQDPFIKHHQPRSVLCTPLLNQGRLIGILYLENNVTTAAFTTDRLEVLNLLAAQAAISLENAKLYTTLEHKVQERTAQLQQANEEISALNERLKQENLRLEAEIDISRRLQQMLLPRQDELQQVAGLDIAGFMDPADEVGGDYYDVLQHDGRVKIGIGDVTGHGLESGVVMLMVQTAVRTLLTSDESDPTRLFTILNRTMYDNINRLQVDKSLTLALLDYQDQRLRLSGQHESLILVRNGGHVDVIDTIDLGFPIGLDDDIASFIAETTIHLDSGDGVVLYTDGITEAENRDGEQYTLERLCAIVQRAWGGSADEVKQAIIEDVMTFIGSQKIFDDLTLLVLRQR